MAEILKEELNIEEFEIKEELVSIKEEILPFSTIQDTCTVSQGSYYQLQNKVLGFSDHFSPYFNIFPQLF